MKEKINIIIEEIIKSTIYEVNQKYVIIDNKKDKIRNSVISEAFWGVSFVTDSQAESKVLQYLFSAAGVSIGNTLFSYVVSPSKTTSRLIGIGGDSFAGVLYLLASKEFWSLSNSAETEAQSAYFFIMAAVYFIAGSALVVGVFSRLFGAASKAVNYQTLGHNIAEGVAAIITKTDPDDNIIQQILKRSTPESIGGKPMSVHILSDGRVFTCYNEKVVFYTDGGVDYVMLRGDKAQQFANEAKPQNEAFVFSDDDLATFNSDELATGSIFSESDGDFYVFPANQVQIGEGDVGPITTSSILENSKKSISNVEVEIQQARANAVDDEITSELRKITEDLNQLTNTWDSLKSTLDSAEAKDVQKELNKGLDSAAKAFGESGVMLSQSQIDAGINATDLKGVSDQITQGLGAVKKRISSIDSKKQGPASELSKPTTKTSKSSSGTKTPASQKDTGAGESILKKSQTNRKKFVKDTIESLQEDSVAINNALSSNPVTIPYQIKDKNNTNVVYNAEIQFFAYQSPGVYIGRITHREQISAIENELVQLSREIKGEYSSISAKHGAISSLYTKGDDGIITLNSYKKKDLSDKQLESLKDFGDDVSSYNNKVLEFDAKDAQLQKLRSLDQKQSGPGSTVYPIHRKKVKELDDHFRRTAPTGHLEDCADIEPYLKLSPNTWRNTLWGIANKASRSRLTPLGLNLGITGVFTATNVTAIQLFASDTTNYDPTSDTNPQLSVRANAPKTLDGLLTDLELDKKIEEAEKELEASGMIDND